MTNTSLAALPVAFPAESRISGSRRSADLADAYAIDLPDRATRDPKALARFIFSRPPPAMRLALKARDLLVLPFGIKTTRHLQASGASSPGQNIGTFRIYDSDASEIILGGDDTHLDFRLSVLCRPVDGSAGNASQLVLSTIVECHNTIGRAYVALVARFHRLVVRSAMRRAARSGWPARDSESPQA